MCTYLFTDGTRTGDVGAYRVTPHVYVHMHRRYLFIICNMYLSIFRCDKDPETAALVEQRPMCMYICTEDTYL